MDNVTLIIAGTESIIPTSELTIERIIAEARSMGFEEFSVFCNDKEITKPEDFTVTPGATYIIASPDDALSPDDISYETLEDEDGPE
ncbi:MAG: hypothetical protein JKY84_00835 [Emcibacteraceae bacterium]|nr:hypothetical protein [Emcibacteraceae bacterium]